MRVSGFVQVPRMWWASHPDNPFWTKGAVARNAKLVALAVVSWAHWHPDDPRRYLCEFSFEELSCGLGLSKSSIHRAIAFLENRNFCETVKTKEKTVLRLNESMTKYMYNRENLKDKHNKNAKTTKSENIGKLDKNATQDLSIQKPFVGTTKNADYENANDCNDSVTLNDTETPWNGTSNSGTAKAGLDYLATYCDDSEKYTSDKTEIVYLERNCELLCNNSPSERLKKEERYIHGSAVSTSAFRKSQKEDKKTADRNTNTKAADKSKDKQPTKGQKKARQIQDQEEDLQTPTDPATLPQNDNALWKLANRYAMGLNAISGLSTRRLPVKRFKDDFCRLQSIYGVTIEQLSEMVEARFSHPYWGTKDLHPMTLTQPTKFSDDPWAEVFKYSQNKKKNVPSIKEQSLNSLDVLTDEHGVRWFQGQVVR